MKHAVKHSQLAYVISRRTDKPEWVATTSQETTADLLRRVNAKRLIKRVNTNPAKVNPTVAGLKAELAQEDRDIAELETDPFYRETPGRRAYARKWLAHHRRQRRKVEQLLKHTERVAQQRKNGIVEAAAGLQALEFFGKEAKRGIGRRSRYNPGEDRFLLQIVKASGGREQTTAATEKQAREIAASWYSRGASVTVVDRKKKTQTVYGKKNPHYSFVASTKTRGRVQGVVKASTKGSAARKVKRELQGDGVGRVVVRKNPRAKGSRDALGVFHAENPEVVKRFQELAIGQSFRLSRGGKIHKKVDSQYGITMRARRGRDVTERLMISPNRAVLVIKSRKAKNPSVTDLSRTFQGEADGSIERQYAADSAPANIARAGKLVFIKANGKTFRLPGAMVGIAPNGKLWITGPGALFETKARKGQGLDVGEVSHICYETAKAHIGKGRTFEYMHEFGEDGGRRPHLIIDHEGMPILRGGDYKIRAEGIVN